MSRKWFVRYFSTRKGQVIMSPKVSEFVAKYAKFLVSLLTAVGATTIASLLTGFGSTEMWVTAIVTLITTAAVYAFPDGVKNWQHSLKGLVAVIGAVGTGTVISIAQGDITTEGLVVAVIAFLGAVSTWSTPNVARGEQLVSVPVGEQVITVLDGEVKELVRGRGKVAPRIKAVSTDLFVTADDPADDLW